MGWVQGVVSSVGCRASLHLSGMKDDFVCRWADSAGKCTSCGVLFIVVSVLNCIAAMNSVDCRITMKDPRHRLHCID